MCPFREHGGVKLTRARAKEIAHAIIDEGRAFPCHETIEYTDDPTVNEGRGFQATLQTRHCYGAARLLVALKKPNQSLQIAQRLGLFTPRMLKGNTVRTALTLGEWMRFTKGE
jgi:hypothetical protein